MAGKDSAIPGGERTVDRATVRTRDRSSDQLDTAFDLLADARRRYAIYCLRTRDQPIGVADLAADVAAELRDEPVDAVPDDAVEATYAALYHVHLPKLDDEGIVRFRRDRTCVSLGENEDALAPYLSLAATEELSPTTIENSLPEIETTYVDDGPECRSATCRFENGAQLRVREVDDGRVAVETFRPGETLSVARLRTERTTDAAEERLRSLTARYRDCRVQGDRDELGRELPGLAAVLGV